MAGMPNPIVPAPAPPSLDAYLNLRPPAPAPNVVTKPPLETPLQQGFSDVVASMKQHGADASHPKFGQLLG